MRETGYIKTRSTVHGQDGGMEPADLGKMDEESAGSEAYASP